jgi:hypothetical protein
VEKTLASETTSDTNEDVEWEMCCSDREFAAGFIPFSNLDMASVLATTRNPTANERLTPHRVKRLTRCPECEGQNLIPVVAGRKMNFFCSDCTLCWHLDRDEPARVNPWTCPGCALVTTACFERYDRSSKATPGLEGR